MGQVKLRNLASDKLRSLDSPLSHESLLVTRMSLWRRLCTQNLSVDLRLLALAASWRWSGRMPGWPLTTCPPTGGIPGSEEMRHRHPDRQKRGQEQKQRELRISFHIKKTTTKKENYTFRGLWALRSIFLPASHPSAKRIRKKCWFLKWHNT